ncbi:MAG: peptidoglycan-binding domain-containing protein [Terriglobales bacterium]
MKLGGSISTTVLCAGCIVLLVCGTGSAQTKSRPSAPVGKKSTAKLKAASAHPAYSKSRKSHRKVSSRRHGQLKIDAARAREIQEALIREHYLDGAPSGTWDAKSQSAMQRYQANHGWQSKSVPDSRALIKLGLGPDHEHLLNPESAMTSLPETLHATPMLEQTSSIETQK